jgi:hypothetical protein
MNTEERTARREALRRLISMIEPLPAHIMPSKSFREQTRLQLLQLGQHWRGATPKAA